MLNQIINLVFMTSFGTCYALVMDQIMNRKTERLGKGIRILHWTFFSWIPSMIGVYISPGQDTVLIRLGIYWIGAISAIILYYRDPIWRRIIAMLAVYFIGAVGDLSCGVAMQVMHIDMTLIADRSTDISVVFVMLGTIMSWFFSFALVYTWKKVFRKGGHMKHLWFVVLYTLNFVCAEFVMEFLIWKNDLIMSAVYVVFVGCFCKLALIPILFSQVEKNELKEKLIISQREAELERLHYQEVEHRREEIKHLVEKNRKYLEEIKVELSNCHSKDAEVLLNRLSNQIDNTKEYRYCSVPVINALLAEKQKECDRNDIHLQTALFIPMETDISQMDFCRIIGNLMDNAIRACSEYKGKREIYLEAAMKHNYFIIKCRNKTPGPDKTKKKGVGYGHKIIKDIVNIYGGDFNSQHKENEYQAQVTIFDKKSANFDE